MHNDFSLTFAPEKGLRPVIPVIPVMRSRAIRRPATVQKKDPDR
jgi:hypothetical protein